MEKEKVLEIEYQDVFDKVAVRIKYQNFEVLKRGKFYDKETGVESCFEPEYCEYDNKFYIQGKEKNKDSKILLVDKEDLKEILKRVNKINEKYGITKKWRAKCGEIYHYIDNSGNINYSYDIYGTTDDIRYNLGNYFEAKEKGQKVI